MTRSPVPSVYLTPQYDIGIEGAVRDTGRPATVLLTSSDSSSDGIIFVRRQTQQITDDCRQGDDVTLANIHPSGDMFVHGSLFVSGNIIHGGVCDGDSNSNIDGGQYGECGWGRQQPRHQQQQTWEPTEGVRAVSLREEYADFRVGIGTSNPAHKLHVMGGSVAADSFSGRLPFADLVSVPAADGNTPEVSGVVRLTNSLTEDATDIGVSAAAARSLAQSTQKMIRRTGDSMTGDLHIAEGAHLIVDDMMSVGTSTPHHAVDVVGNVNFTGDLLKNGRVYPDPGLDVWRWSDTEGKAFLNTSSSNPRVGVGTVDPRCALDVVGDLEVSGAIFQDGRRLTHPWTGGGDGDGTSGSEMHHHVVYAGECNVGIGVRHPVYKLQVDGSIFATGNVIQSSDRHRKCHVLPIDRALDRVDSLTGYTYEFTDDSYSYTTESSSMGRAHRHHDRHAGVMAQDMLLALPEAVARDPTDGSLGVSYGNVVPLLIEAIKELRSQVHELKAER